MTKSHEDMQGPALDPFFEAPPGEPPARRLLLLTYHYPPASSVGARRWEKMTALLAAQGWSIDAVTLTPESAVSSNPSRMMTLPPGTRLFGVPETRSLASRINQAAVATRKLLRRTSQEAIAGTPEGDGAGDASSVPPERVRFSPISGRSWVRAFNAVIRLFEERAWATSAERVGAQLLTNGSYDVLATSGPPHAIHYRGWRLARQYRIPHVMDLRDPWSLPRRLPEGVASPILLTAARIAESRAVNDAALVVANTEPVRTEMQRLYPQAADRIITVMNGFDDEPLPRPAPSPFTIVYAGLIYLDRDPTPLFRAARLMISTLHLSPNELRIVLIGHVESYGIIPTARIAEEIGVGAYVELRPPQPRDQLFRSLAHATVLVSLPQDSRYAIPAKIFEYIRFPAWVLVLAAPESAVAQVMAGTGADIVDPKDVAGIAAALSRRFQELKTSGRPAPIADTAEHLSRREQTARLIGAVEEVVCPVAHRRP